MAELVIQHGRWIHMPTIWELPGISLPARDTSLKQRLDQGRYNSINSNILAETLFPITLDGGPRNLVLAHFGVQMPGESVKAWATQYGYGPAFHEDLLAVGAVRPDLQFRNPIVQVGSIAEVDGDLCVSCLDAIGRRRLLRLDYYRFEFCDAVQFLLVKLS